MLCKAFSCYFLVFKRLVLTYYFGSFCRIMPNPCPHIALPVKCFLVKHNILQLKPPLVFSGLCTRKLFPFKTLLKKSIFLDIDKMKENMTSEIRRIPKVDLASCFSSFIAVREIVLRETEITSKHIKRLCIVYSYYFTSPGN